VSSTTIKNQPLVSVVRRVAEFPLVGSQSFLAAVKFNNFKRQGALLLYCRCDAMLEEVDCGEEGDPGGCKHMGLEYRKKQKRRQKYAVCTDEGTIT